MYELQTICSKLFDNLPYFILQAKVFAFDKVLKPNVTQDFVYTVSAKPIVAGKSIRKSSLSVTLPH